MRSQFENLFNGFFTIILMNGFFNAHLDSSFASLPQGTRKTCGTKKKIAWIHSYYLLSAKKHRLCDRCFWRL